MARQRVGDGRLGRKRTGADTAVADLALLGEFLDRTEDREGEQVALRPVLRPLQLAARVHQRLGLHLRLAVVAHSGGRLGRLELDRLARLDLVGEQHLPPLGRLLEPRRRVLRRDLGRRRHRV